ncbi:protoporphyrinogen oxidase [Candidatus Chloroploca sp. M-50]|uniref:Coproporphyrinogen III oxidase n=1 Tax=Candidatus Chloroploca mongolica TaxID=2528176 RepID=A0ABS4DEB6_9CHLR|nr:protoporphyrinogen oxidase [Candidatus Chloroploca mongolica]MBP1467795.1 protoporphyrinogen oxidase [Candidatus Chloroploca mongolica]
MHTYDAVIVGGGISGLSAAYTLYKRGFEVLVIEAHAEVGGSMQSMTTRDGYVLDCGPNTVTTKDARLWAEFADLGLLDSLIAADRSGTKRYILLDGKPAIIPSSPPALIKTPLLSTAAKLRFVREPFVSRSGAPDESVADFFTRRLGPEPTERLIDPFVSGVYSGDPRKMSVKAAFPSLWEAEQRGGSIVRGMLKGRQRPAKGTPKGPKMRSVLFGFPGGIADWPKAIARTLGPNRVWSSARATDLFQEGANWRLVVERNGRTEPVVARAVVLATSAFVAADLIDAIANSAATALREIPYAPVNVVHLGYRRDQVAHPLDGFGVLAPSCEQRNFLGILWSSTLFRGRAPEGKVLTTTLVGGSLRPDLTELDDASLVKTIAAENADVLGITGLPEMSNVARWPHALPQYTFGHTERIAALEATEQRLPGLFFVGNYRGGVGVPKCWKNGATMGERVAAALHAQPAQVAVEK